MSTAELTEALNDLQSSIRTAYNKLDAETVDAKTFERNRLAFANCLMGMRVEQKIAFMAASKLAQEGTSTKCTPASIEACLECLRQSSSQGRQAVLDAVPELIDFTMQGVIPCDDDDTCRIHLAALRNLGLDDRTYLDLRALTEVKDDDNAPVFTVDPLATLQTLCETNAFKTTMGGKIARAVLNFLQESFPYGVEVMDPATIVVPTPIATADTKSAAAL